MKTYKSVISAVLVLVMLLGMVPAAAMAAESTAAGTVGMQVTSASAQPGGTVDVVITVLDNPGIASLKFDVAYDNCLTLTNVELGSNFGSYITTPVPYANPQPITVISPLQDVAGTGVLATLTFAVSADAEDGYAAGVRISHNPDDVFNGTNAPVTLSAANGTVFVYHKLPGDVNGDGKLNPKDPVALFRYVAGWPEAVDEDALDYNGDTKINTKDAIDLFRYVAGWEGIVGHRHVHKITPVAKKDATCTVDGNTAHYCCEKCGKLYSDEGAENEIEAADTVIPATKHAGYLQKVEAKEPTVNAPGNDAYWKCSLCGLCYSDEAAKNQITEESTVIPAKAYYTITFMDSKNWPQGNKVRFAQDEALELTTYYPPAVTGYEFGGWYTKSTFGDANKLDNIPAGNTENKTVYAKWNAIPYKIKYNEAGVNKNKIEYTIEEEVLLDDPEWSGLKFAGWIEPTGRLEFYENQVGKTVARIPKGTTGDIEITAKWTTYENLVNPKENGKLSAVFDPATQKYYFLYDLGMIENVPLDQVFETYEKSTTGDFTMSISNSVTVETSKAQSIAQTMMNSVTQTQQYQDTIGSLNEDTIEEHLDISIGVEAGVKDIFKASLQTDFGFSGSFTSQSTNETVTGTVTDEHSGSEKEYSSTITYAEALTTTSDTSMLIKGDMPNGTYAFVHAGDIRVFALITYDPVDGWYYMNTISILDNMHTIMLYYADKETMYDSPCGGLTAEVPVETIKEYVESCYYVQYNANGGDGAMLMSAFASGESGTLSENKFSKVGYTFDHWKLVKSDGTTEVYLDKAQICDIASGGETIELIAQWKANTYTVNYAGNGNTGGSTATSVHTYGEKKALSANGFVRKYTVTYHYTGSGAANTTATANYSFAGWRGENGTAYGDKEAVLNLKSEQGATTTMTAQWKSVSVTLPKPTRTGYTFDGWYTDTNYTKLVGNGGAAYTPESDIDLYAKWKANTYTVTFKANGGSGSDKTQTFTYDKSDALTGNSFTRTNYVFRGWSTSSTAITATYKDKQTVTNLAASGNVKLYAVWVKTTANIAFTESNGSRNKTLGEGETYTEVVSTGMDKAALIESGYTKIQITVKFDAKRSDPIMYNNAVLRITSGGTTLGERTWDIRDHFDRTEWTQDVEKTIEVSISDLGNDISFALNWSNVDDGTWSKSEEWYLGETNVTVTAK